MENLLGTIHTTFGMQEDKKPLLIQDQMYQSLGEQKRKVFLVYEVLVEAVKKQWYDPKRKPVFSRALKCRVLFQRMLWNKSPKLNTAFFQGSGHTDLVFEDIGVLSDSMDKKMDSLLKKPLGFYLRDGGYSCGPQFRILSMTGNCRNTYSRSRDV